MFEAKNIPYFHWGGSGSDLLWGEFSADRFVSHIFQKYSELWKSL